MKDVAVVVPWRGGDPYREAAWEWVRARLTAAHPWPIIEGTDGTQVRGQESGAVQEGRGPQNVAEDGEGHAPQAWVKARAVMPAIANTDAPVVVVSDADVWCDGLALAVDQVRAGAPWAIPHRRVRRLNERSTRRVLHGELPDRLPLEEPPYVGAPTGGLVVLQRDIALDVPMDPRFEGWGGEDRSWGRALECLVGEPWRGDANLFHLYHPPQERVDRNHGRAETEALRKRYMDARHNPPEMRALLEEIR